MYIHVRYDVMGDCDYDVQGDCRHDLMVDGPRDVNVVMTMAVHCQDTKTMGICCPQASAVLEQ